MRDVSARIGEQDQVDEMAGPSYLHPFPLVRWLFWKRLEVVARLLGAPPMRYHSGLDFGCGLGVFLPTLSAVTERVYASDLVLQAARHLGERMGLGNITFLAPADLPRTIPPQSLDYVVTTDVLEHVDDLQGVIALFATLLRPGGRLIVSGPTENALYKAGRVLVGFGGKGAYHHTEIHAIHRQVRALDAFRVLHRKVLPVPYLVEAFHVYSYQRV